jgi:arabinose-5-phosphate isomerase
MEMSRKGLGMTGVVDKNGKLVGVFTDGDLRRALDTEIDIRKTTMESVMHRGGIVSNPDTMAAAAVHTMEENKITALLVVDDSGHLIGALNIHDLFRAGVM